jgi:hypothetical protein
MAGAAGSLRGDEPWLVDLELWAVSSGASAWLIDLEPYELCRIAGVVKRLRVDPVNGVVAAVITDGTGEVVAQWAIRRPTPELLVAPGTGVILEGVAALGPGQELILREPRYETVRFLEVA